MFYLSGLCIVGHVQVSAADGQLQVCYQRGMRRLVPGIIASVDANLCAVATHVGIHQLVFDLEGTGIGIIKIGSIVKYLTLIHTENIVGASDIGNACYIKHTIMGCTVGTNSIIAINHAVSEKGFARCTITGRAPYHTMVNHNMAFVNVTTRNIGTLS